ncbi:hypothetical protein AB1Y20_001138 [Prymnesium parvum]|uniref:Translin-associated factor X-interacting protein 1 N-terminal domain-containing protein n=1 Tax=Prymnesium parvum TaxID=97485 RepID=A0AB34K6W6_PRYPA
MSAMLSSTTPGVRSSPNLSHNAPVRCTTSASTSLLAEPAPNGGWTMPPATPPRGGTANSRSAVRSPSLPARLLEQRARVLGAHHENVLNAAALLKVDRRQRTFAALAHDTACLQQMAAVLSQRLAMAAKESMVGLVEETQLYAVCMEELAVQISIHSMPLSEVASSLYRGFTLLFKRALEHEKARLAKEREAHAVTRENLAQALRQGRESREEAAKSEGKLSVLRAAFDEKDRELTHAQDLYRQTRSQARRMRKLLDGYVHSTGSTKEPTFEDTPLKVLTDSVAKVDETAEEAERASEEIGRTVDTLHLMARALTMHSGKRRKEEAGVQTDAEDADTAGGQKPFELQRDKSALVGAKQASAMSKMRRRAIEGTITVYKGASLLPRALAQKVTFFLLTSDPAVIEAVIDDRSRSDTELSSPLAEHMYNVYLRLYGVKKLSEGHIASLLLTTLQMAEEGDERMVLFTSMLGLISDPMEERDAQLVNLLYYELAGVAASSESDAPERVSVRALRNFSPLAAPSPPC